MQIVTGLDGDENDPVVAVTTPGGNQAAKMKNVVGVGNRYYVFATIPFSTANGIVVNFIDAATCDEDDGVNSANMIVMLETPPLSRISEPT